MKTVMKNDFLILMSDANLTVDTMRLPFGFIEDFLLKQESRKHEAIKKDIERLQTERGLLIINKDVPPFRITLMDKRIKRLQKRICLK